MPNQLADSTSPYLLQHADNPVDWWQWGDDAFAEAKRRDVPILLSIGYSSCHWCHVMAHESFEDHAIADLINESFVAIKVDREERPDIDQLYMDAVVALTGSGGWPMTVFLTPSREPFFGGTYFPAERRGSMMSFPELLVAITALWKDRRPEVTNQATLLTNALRERTELTSSGPVPDEDNLKSATERLLLGVDHDNGGFGTAPKFPQVLALEYLLARFVHTGDSNLLDVVTTAADAMASGGIHDHLGGGFARYSTDSEWLVPHFEKMLYDQALLARLYLHLWKLTSKPGYLDVVDSTLGYVLRDLRHPDGGFYCAEDADSEGAEGRFYLWSTAEVRSVLEPLASSENGDIAEEAIGWWGLTNEGNFDGSNILTHPRSTDTVLPDHMVAARQMLFDHRTRRVRPGLDDKILLEWNGLTVSTLAEAASGTGRSDWLNAAVKAAGFLIDKLRGPDGRWMRSWRGKADTAAVAVDYAAMTDAFVRLAEATGEAHWITEARQTADSMIDLFWDHADGGLFTGGRDTERLLVRSKDFTDSPTASANSLAALTLLRLGALTGCSGYTQRSHSIMAMFGPTAITSPHGFAGLLDAIELAQRGITEVVITGDRPDLVNVVTSRYVPNIVLAWGEPYESPIWTGRLTSSEGAGRAHACGDYTCRRPTDNPEALAAELGTTRALHQGTR